MPKGFTMPTQEQIEFWKFEILRKAATAALCEVSQLLMHQETKNYLEKEDVYHKLAKATKILATAISEATEA